MWMLFALELPFVVLEFVRPGVVMVFLPMTWFFAPLILILPAAFQFENDIPKL